MSKTTNFSKLKKGEVLSEQQFYTVEVIKGDKVQLRNDFGDPIVVTKDYAEKLLTSASQFSKEEKVTKTEAAAMFIGNPGIAITVNFNKQVKEADVVKEVMDAYSGTAPKVFEAALKKAIKKALTGVERTMVGRHYGDMNEFGRINFVDMEEKKTPGGYDTRLRQVDPRGINWFICKGVKYTVK